MNPAQIIRQAQVANAVMRNKESWRRYWTKQDEVLFFGEISKITDGKLYNQKSGATDYLTVGGVAGSYTFQCPNTAPYIAADTDYIWFESTGLQRIPTEAELIGYDFTRSIIKYADASPYSIEAIMILSSDLITNRMRDDFHLSIWWDNTLSFYGSTKGNRGIGKSVWILSTTSFVTTWNTELAGSATKTIVIPTAGSGYDCYINWGDGSAEEHQTGTPGNITHVYSTTGIKTIMIRGTFPRIYFYNGGDKLKLLTIENWGNIVWGSMAYAFWGCANLTGTYSDIPNTTAVTEMKSMFRGCTLFNSAVAFDTVNVNTMDAMFISCPAFNQSLASFNVHLVTTMANMLNGSNSFSTENYDALLIAWAAQSLQSAVPFHAGDAKYSAGAATTARGVLTGAPNLWAITDGGQV